jgi:hypothetical protein
MVGIAVMNAMKSIMMDDSHGHYCVPILFSESVLGVINIYLKKAIFGTRKEEFLAYCNTLTGIIIRGCGRVHEDSEERYRRLVI